jgi:two-component sensor histidine kinase
MGAAQAFEKDIDKSKTPSYFSADTTNEKLPLSLVTADQTVALKRLYEDRDEEGQYVWLDSTVVIAGRANTASGQFHELYLQSYIQDDSVGFSIFSEKMGTEFESGDSLIVRGKVQVYLGLLEVLVQEYRVLPDSSTLRSNLVTLPIERILEQPDKYIGMLVQGRGSISEISNHYNGKYLKVRLNDQPDREVPIYITNFHADFEKFELDELNIGDQVTFRGVFTQFDFDDDGEANFVITPRQYQDLASGFFTARIRNISLGLISIIALLGIVWIVTLQRKVKTRTYALEQALDERDDLIREVHHRIKNNLGVVSGLLQLQKECTSSDVAKEILDNSNKRIASIANVHSQLHQTREGGTERVEMSDYLYQLVCGIQDSMDDYDKGIQVHTSLDTVTLNADQATYCGLLLNELMVNSYKYAFNTSMVADKDESDVESPTITVELTYDKESEWISLRVSDNGIGIEREELSEVQSLGMKLIKSFTKQLKGTIKFDEMHRPGTSARISFPRK